MNVLWPQLLKACKSLLKVLLKLYWAKFNIYNALSVSGIISDDQINLTTNDRPVGEVGIKWQCLYVVIYDWQLEPLAVCIKMKQLWYLETNKYK